MPRLALIAPCENLIVSNDNKLSLISLLESISIGIPANQQIPPNASIPMRWFALTVWEKQADDANKEFESYTQIGPLESAHAKFRMTTPLHRVMAQIFGFPLQFGEMRLKAYIKEVGAGGFVLAGEFPLNVQRVADVVPGQAN